MKMNYINNSSFYRKISEGEIKQRGIVEFESCNLFVKKVYYNI